MQEVLHVSSAAWSAGGVENPEQASTVEVDIVALGGHLWIESRIQNGSALGAPDGLGPVAGPQVG